jgi:23S rRNA U2552 (ribose-2'-O)-methylase RlmE/FtsJ
MNGLPTKSPPWEMIFFQKSPLPSDTLANPFWTSIWNESPHEEINQLKQEITPYEKAQTWETLKKLSNPYELVYTHEAEKFPPSLAIQKPLSRSYFKMIEMLEVSHFFQNLPKQTQVIRSAHVAEGPGGFIEAICERASLYSKKVSKALGMTLRPTGSNVPGWRKAYSFLKSHPEVIIHYGIDGTGDIYSSVNQQSFIETCGGKVQIFTADGGFDFSEDYSTQEQNVFPLLIASAKIGIQCLGQDGLFIMKVFDIFGQPTQFLIRLITYCFKEWTLYKPATSRPCNSERYLLCRGFRKCHPEVLRILTYMESQYASNREYPDGSGNVGWSDKEAEFLSEHISSFTKMQCETIQKSFASSGKSLDTYDWNEQIQNAHVWCSHFRVIDQIMQNSAKYKAFGYKKPY